jgi:lambda family phage portal protein
MKTEIKPNLFDRIVTSVSPDRGLKRLIARQKIAAFDYDGARNTRARGNPPPLQASESSRNQMDRINLMKSARNLANNVGFVKSIVLKLCTYVCGTLRYQSRTGDRGADKIIEAYLEGRFENCDITGRHNLTGMAQLTLSSTFLDGDMGFIYVSQPGGVKLQAIEADRIGGIYDSMVKDDYFGGIKINSVGMPVSYRVFERSVNGQYQNPRDIPAAAFLHFFDPFRFDQYRGITAFHACANTLLDIYEILDFEKQAVKWASSMAGVVTNETGSDQSGYSFDETSSDANRNPLRLQSVEAATVQYLAKGEDIKTFMSDRPSVTFQGFIQALYREVALSLNLPYGFVYDLSNLSGPTARLESAQAQRAFHRWQQLLEDKMLNKIKNRFLSEGLAAGEIPNIKTWNQGKWMFPAHPTIDVGRESQANLAENKQGLKTAADIYAEQGKDWEEEQEQLATEAANLMRLAKEKDVPIDMIQMLTPNGTLPQQQEEQKKEEKE